MGISRKCICLKSFNKLEMGSISNSQKMQQQEGKEKAPAVDLLMVPPADNNMDSSSGNSKGYRKKIKKKCHRVFKAVLSKKKQSTKQDDILKSSISALDDALRPLNPLDEGGGGAGGESASVSSRYSLLSSSSLPAGASSSSFSGQLASSSLSNCSSIANSRSGSDRKQYSSCNVVDLKSQPLIKNDFPGTVKRSCTSGRNHAIYFVLVCLVGVVFGGKALAIFCTSSCLFLLPCCLRRFAKEK